MRAGKEAVGHIHIASPPKRTRPIQPLPTLWNVKSSDARKRLYCGPVAVAALIGADVDEVIRIARMDRDPQVFDELWSFYPDWNAIVDDLVEAHRRRPIKKSS
jgi:hypothetical protein